MARAQYTYTGHQNRVPAAWLAAAGACVSLLGLVAFHAYAYAQQGDTAVLMGGRGEYYLAALPLGWGKRTEAADALGHHGDWLPDGQSLADWRDRITVQVVPELAGEPPPDFLDRMADLRAQTCAHMFATEVENTSLNGFAVGLRVIACTRDKRTGTGEVIVMRALTGARALRDPARVPGRPVSGAGLPAQRRGARSGAGGDRIRLRLPARQRRAALPGRVAGRARWARPGPGAHGLSRRTLIKR